MLQGHGQTGLPAVQEANGGQRAGVVRMMTCEHGILRRTTRGLEKGIPWDRIPLWKCMDCGKIFDIEEISEELLG